MRLLTRHDAEVGAWIGEKLGQAIVKPFGAIGITDDDGSLIAGWCVTGLNDFNADLTVYAPGCLTRRTLRACFAHLFIDLGVIRVTAMTRRDNEAMRIVLPRIGFQFEGLRRRYYGPNKRHDAFCYGIFRDQAERWLRG